MSNFSTVSRNTYVQLKEQKW